MSIFEAVVLEAEAHRLRAENETLRERLIEYQQAAKMDEAPVLRDELQQARARIAELEARLTPVKFSEREPEEAGRYQVVPANSWQWTTTYWNPESVEIREYVLREYAYWLPIPPAPEESA